MKIFKSGAILLLLIATLAVSGTARAEKRVALVIGNSNYSAAGLISLANPGNDARDIAAVLKKQGFTLVGGGVQLDLDRQTMLERILQFGDRLGPDTVGLFYYAGHGIAMSKTNYLVPVDGGAKSKREVAIKMVSADYIMEQFRETGGGLNIMILDACRNTPAAYRGIRAGGGDGLAEMQGASGTLISYATQPGNVAKDGDGRNSPYAKALIDVMQLPGLGVLQAFNEVSLQVKKATNNFQVPWNTSVALEGDFYFAGRGASAQPAKADQPAMSADMLAWQSIQNSANAADFETFLKTFPDSPFAGFARNRLAALKKPAETGPPQVAAVTPPPVVKPKSQARPTVGVFPGQYQAGQTFKDCPDCPEMVVVPAGSFRMGDLAGSGTADERPVRQVTIFKPFAVGRFEVTQAEWSSVMGGSPKKGGKPIDRVSWENAKAFASKLSAKTGKRYRLLSEAEWEYMARAGSTTRYPWGNTVKQGQKNRLSSNSALPVGSYPANTFGVFDTAGGVWEWVEDCWNNTYQGAPSDGTSWTAGDCTARVLRGGSWFTSPNEARAANRHWNAKTTRKLANGFRIARDLP